MISDSIEVARASKRNGGRVVVCAGLLVQPDYGEELLAAREVDCIVLDPSQEQCVGAKYSRPWPFLTLEDQAGWTTADGARPPSRALCPPLPTARLHTRTPCRTCPHCDVPPAPHARPPRPGPAP